MADSQWYVFNEDSRRIAPTCLDKPVRAVAFRRAMVRTSDMRWVPAIRGRAAPEDEDTQNPGSPACANFDVRPGPHGLELVTGGTTISNPHARRDHAIPR